MSLAIDKFITGSNFMNDFEKHVEEYLEECDHTSLFTVKAKRIDLCHFFASLSDRNKINLTTLTCQDVENFVTDRYKKDKISTLQRRLATVKHFCKFLAQKYQTKNAARKTKIRSSLKPYKNGFSEKEIEAMRSELEIHYREDYFAYRLLIIFELMRLQGLRVSEIRELIKGQLNYDNTSIQNVRGKAGSIYNIDLHSSIVRLLTGFLSYREKEFLQFSPTYVSSSRDEEYPLLASFYNAKVGKPETFKLNQKSIWHSIRRLGERCGVMDCHPHRLRHTHAHDMLKASKNNLRLVQQEMRHQNIKDTVNYLNSTQEEQRTAREAIR